MQNCSNRHNKSIIEGYQAGTALSDAQSSPHPQFRSLLPALLSSEYPQNEVKKLLDTHNRGVSPAV